MNLYNIGITIVAVFVVVVIIMLNALGILNFNRNMNAELVYQHFHIVSSISRAEAPLYLLM